MDATAPPVIAPGRHPAAVAMAIYDAWRPYRWRGYAAGIVAGIFAGGVIAPIFTSTIQLALGFTGTLDAIPQLAAPVLWTIVFAVVAPFAGAWAAAEWQPRPLRDAAQSYLWLARESESHWREATGRAVVPRDEAGMREFVETTTPTAANAGERFGMWLALGDIERARAAIADMPHETTRERFVHSSATWLANFTAGDDSASPSLEDLDGLAGALEDAREQREARVTLAVQRARVAVASGGNWHAPFEPVRPLLGHEPDDLYRQFVWRPAFRRLFISSVTGIAVYWSVLLLMQAGASAPALSALR